MYATQWNSPAPSDFPSEPYGSPPAVPSPPHWPYPQWTPPAGYEGWPSFAYNPQIPPEYSWQHWMQQSPFSGYPMHPPTLPDIQRAQRKLPRNTFTPEQLRVLNRFFDDNKYLTKETKEIIAGQTRLSERQVKIWFQNQRYKSKKAGPAPR